MTATFIMRTLSSVTGLAITLVAQTAVANSSQIGKDKDWILTEHSSPNGGVCVAATSKNVQKATYRLEVQRSKTRSSVTEVLIREMKHSYAMTGFVTNKDLNGLQLAFPKMEENADSRFFWMVPSNTESVLKGLSDGKKFRVFAQNSSREIKFDFSSRGFAKILTLLQEKCSANGDITNADFEREFLIGLVADRDPTRYDITKTKLLRDIYFKAASIYDQKQVTADDIRRLVNQYSALINEADSLEQRISQLSGIGIPQLERAQVNNQNEKVRLEGELTRLRASIPEIESALRASEKTYEDAYKTIEPHLAEHARLSTNVSEADDSLEEWRNYLASVRSQIRRKENEIDNLESELAVLQQRILQNEREFDRAERLVSEEFRRLNNFNRDDEVRRRLRENSEIPGLRNQLQNARGQLPLVRQEAQRTRQIFERSQLALRECQRTSGADCSSQQAEASRAISDMNQADRAVNAVENDIERLQNRMRSIEDNIERDVESIEADLRRRYYRAVDQRNNIASEISRDESRARNIQNFEIPRLDREIVSLVKNEREAISGISNAEAELREQQDALDTFEQRVGWAPKKLALDQATMDRNQKRTALSQAQQRQANLEQALVSNAREKERLAAELSRAKLELSDAQSRLAQVNAELAPYRIERARLDAVAANVKAQLELEKASFTNNL